MVEGVLHQVLDHSCPSGEIETDLGQQTEWKEEGIDFELVTNAIF